MCLPDADRWPDDTAVRDLCLKAVCTRCGMIGAGVRPNWTERAGEPDRRVVAMIRRRGRLMGSVTRVAPTNSDVASATAKTRRQKGPKLDADRGLNLGAD